MTLKIGNVELENNVILAPMAGVTDMPYRILCREQGAGLVCMEMVSAKAILYKNKNTQELLKVDERERPVSLQLFGSDPDIVADIAASLEDGPYDIFDINMGCPVPKIVKNGEGSALMRNPKLVEEILTKLVKAVKKPWRSQRSPRVPVWRRWLSMEERESSITPEKPTGISSARSKKL